VSEWKAPFASRLWSTRAAVQQGYEALFTVQVRELDWIYTLILYSHCSIIYI
jgi:hypothetical protein